VDTIIRQKNAWAVEYEGEIIYETQEETNAKLLSECFE
jgi:hypothetical protein